MYIGAHDLPYLYPKILEDFVKFPQIWSAKNHDAFGSYNASVLWNWPLEFLYGIGGSLGINYSILILILGIVPFILFGYLGIKKLLSRIDGGNTHNILAIVFFIVNTYTLLLIDGGQLNLAVAYSLIPLVYYYRLEIRKFSLFGIIMSIYDLRILLLVALIIGIRIIFFKNEFKKVIFSGSVLIVSTVIFHLYWIVPSLYYKPPSLPSTYLRSSQVDNLSFANFYHSISFIQPHWPRNVFGNVTNINWINLITPLVIFIPLFIRNKNREVLFWLTLSIVSILLAKGTNPPLVSLYKTLFENVPGLSLFRDPVKFYALIGLSFSVLLSYSLNILGKIKIFPILFFILTYSIIVIPFVNNEFTGILSIPRDIDEHKNIASYLEEQPPGKVLWIPGKSPLGYSDPEHRSVDAVELLNKTPFALSVIGDYETLNFLRDSTMSARLLSESGIKYVVVSPRDEKRESNKREDVEYYTIFRNQLAKSDWASSIKVFDESYLFHVKNSVENFYIRENINVAFSFNVDKDELFSDSSSAIFYPDQFPGISERVYESKIPKKFYGDISEMDIIGTLIPDKFYSNLTSNFDFSPNKMNPIWKRETPDILWTRNFLQQKYNLDNQDFDYGKGVSFIEGNSSFEVKINTCSRDCILLARILKSPKSGTLSFEQNGLQINKINTVIKHEPILITQFGRGLVDDKFYNYSKTKFGWEYVGPYDPNLVVTVNGVGDINIVNSVVGMNIKSFEELSSIKDNLSQPKHDFIEKRSIGINVNEISPTKYILKITGLKAPSLLVFSQNYDPGWKLSGKGPLPIYGFLNGYEVSVDGQYILEYEAQRFVYSGIKLSIIVIILIFFVTLIYIKKRNAKNKK